jgi:hypothetical protein
METNELLRNQILEVVENQIKLNDPPETKQTLKRLKDLGYSDLDARKLIGQCVVVELYDVMKQKKPFDKNRYVSNLEKLPEEPFD